jgi:1-acyl-sn-glycerol-3-phosphate acyltransferase
MNLCVLVTKNFAKKMIRTLFIIIWITFSTIVLGMAVIISAFFSKQGNFPHIIGRFWGKSILFVSRIKVTVKGLSNIDPSKSYIFMPNHQSNFDIPVLLGSLPAQFRWLAKVELFKIPIFGRAMRGCGYISIDRSNRKSAFKSLEKAADTIKKGVSVLIFPEGTRSLDGKIRDFKKGGFVLTVDSGVPIIPVIIHGTWSIMPKSGLRIMPGNVTLEILPPIVTTEYTRKTKDDLMDKVRDIICESFYEGKKEK